MGHAERDGFHSNRSPASRYKLELLSLSTFRYHIFFSTDTYFEIIILQCVDAISNAVLVRHEGFFKCRDVVRYLTAFWFYWQRLRCIVKFCRATMQLHTKN